MQWWLQYTKYSHITRNTGTPVKYKRSGNPAIKSAPSFRGYGSPSDTCFLVPHDSVLVASRSVQPFSHSSPNTQTTPRCDICRNKPHLECLRCGRKVRPNSTRPHPTNGSTQPPPPHVKAKSENWYSMTLKSTSFHSDDQYFTHTNSHGSTNLDFKSINYRCNQGWQVGFRFLFFWKT